MSKIGARESSQDVLVITLKTTSVYHYTQYLDLNLQSFPLTTVYLCLVIAEFIHEICSYLLFFSCNP